MGSAADRIKRQNTERLKEKSRSADELKLANLLKESNALKSDDAKLKLLSCHLEDLAADPAVYLRAHLEILLLLEKQWWTECAQKSRAESSRSMRFAVDLVNHLHVIVRRFCSSQKHLDALLDEKTAAIEKILAAFVSLGFDDAVSALAAKLRLPAKRAKVKADTSLGDVRVGMSYTRFQMIHMGHLSVRDVDSRSDARVSFEPDAWQCELLDIVDKRQSALVCAPTSSGKTFISYYLMREVNTTEKEGRSHYPS